MHFFFSSEKCCKSETMLRLRNSQWTLLMCLTFLPVSEWVTVQSSDFQWLVISNFNFSEKFSHPWMNSTAYQTMEKLVSSLQKITTTTTAALTRDLHLFLHLDENIIEKLPQLPSAWSSDEFSNTKTYPAWIIQSVKWPSWMIKHLGFAKGSF